MLQFRLLLTLLIAGVLTLPLQAATITVADAGADHTSIQAAMDAANNGDEILVSPGTYLENIDFNGKAITLRSASGDPADTIIDGGGNGSVVTCASGETSSTVLDGFTITNGSATYGGGMYNSISSPTVTNCTFSGNTATSRGGGMYNQLNSSPTVSHCIFSGNTASSGGGGMYNENGNPTVTNCTFSGNTANAGGGMNNSESSPTVSHCTFSGNTAGWGGVMYNRYSSPAVTNCVFTGNTSDYGGGGMRNTQNSSPTVTNCILWGDSPDEIDNSGGSTPTVRFSDLQGGLPANTIDGGGNIAVDPLFVDADGSDNMAGTEDDNLRLLGGSPCIDAADTTALPVGVFTDLDGNPRGLDYPLRVNTGIGVDTMSLAGTVYADMGAYEFQADCGIPGDINCDGIVNLLDQALLALHWLETN